MFGSLVPSASWPFANPRNSKFGKISLTEGETESAEVGAVTEAEADTADDDGLYQAVEAAFAAERADDHEQSVSVRQW